jgi:ribose 5-phosphate isomerase RpiB
VIVTARQLEDLHRQNGGNGRLVLPYRARLTPLAQDWVKSKRLALGYSDIASATTPAAAPAPSEKKDACCEKCSHGGGACCSSAYLWWCDGPCGPAKAALTVHEKESDLKPLEVQGGANQMVAIVKKLAAEVKAGQAAGGILMVQNAASVMVFANRCPSLRAVFGSCQYAVEQGVQQVAANVLVIEYPYKTLQQMKNMLGRFVKAKRELSADVKLQLQELSTCA